MMWLKDASRGGGHQKVTSLLRGGHRKVTLGDKGGVKNLKIEVTSFMDSPLHNLPYLGSSKSAGSILYLTLDFFRSISTYKANQDLKYYRFK